MDPTIKHTLDQGFATGAQMFQQAGARFNAGVSAIEAEAHRMFLQGNQLIGAAAAQTLTNGLARDILNQRSVSDQPKA